MQTMILNGLYSIQFEQNDASSRQATALSSDYFFPWA